MPRKNGKEEDKTNGDPDAKEAEYVRREALYRQIAEVSETPKHREYEQKYFFPDSIPTDLVARVQLVGKTENGDELIHVKQGYTIDGVRLRQQIFTKRHLEVLTDGSVKIYNPGESMYTVSYKKRLDDSGIERDEPETVISKETFEKYWPLVGDRIIEKERYVLRGFIGTPQGPARDLHYDLYTTQRLQGLIITEIEFPTREEANLYIEPPVQLKGAVNVTGIKPVSNKEMAFNKEPLKNLLLKLNGRTQKLRRRKA